MPPKQKYTKDMLVNVARTVIDNCGVEKLSHRSIAKEMGCSTQPILSNFESIEDVRVALRDVVDAELNEILNKEVEGASNNFAEMLYAYIAYANAHPNLFLFICFESKDYSNGREPLRIEKRENVRYVNELMQRLNLSYERAVKLYKICWYFAHGLALAKATGQNKLSMEEMYELIHTATDGGITKPIV